MATAPDRSASGSPQPLPPWLRGGRENRPPRAGSLGWLRAPGLVLAGVALGWLIPGWKATPAPAALAAAPTPASPPVACPAPPPCTAQSGNPGGAASPHLPHAHSKPASRAMALHPLPAETAPTAENRRDALRAFAQQKADDLRGCLGAPGRGPLRRVGAALEIDSHGTVAAVQILGGDTGNRELESCYSAHLRAWRFPETLLQGDERLLVNFVL